MKGFQQIAEKLNTNIFRSKSGRILKLVEKCQKNVKFCLTYNKWVKLTFDAHLTQGNFDN